MTQAQVGETIGLEELSARTTFSRGKKTDRKPSLEAAVLLAEALGCSLDDLAAEQETSRPAATIR